MPPSVAILRSCCEAARQSDSESARYSAYVAAVRKEFQFLSDDEFRNTRVAMIERFLRRPQIYFTRAMQERFEAQARVNLSQEFLALSC